MEERRGADGLFEETFPSIHNRALHKMESLVGKKSSWELNSSCSRISFLPTLGYYMRLCVCNWRFLSQPSISGSWFLLGLLVALLQLWKIKLDYSLSFHDHILMQAPLWARFGHLPRHPPVMVMIGLMFPWTPWVTCVSAPLVNLRASQN